MKSDDLLQSNPTVSHKIVALSFDEINLRQKPFSSSLKTLFMTDSDRNIHFLWVESDFGAGTHGASLGPDALKIAAMNKKSDIFRLVPFTEISTIDLKFATQFSPVHETVYPNAKMVHHIRATYERIMNEVARILYHQYFPFVISGDHSNAGGTIAGIKRAFPEKRLGVIWIDAHADIHSPFTTPSGNMHGMPLAVALNEDNEKFQINDMPHELKRLWRELCHLGGFAPKIYPQDLVYIGLRDYEEPEKAVIEEKNIRYYVPEKVDARGAENIARETLDYLKDCDLIYVSFDIDSLDKKLVSGTGTPVDRGLSIGQAQILLKNFWAEPRLCAMEFTEINPLLDIRNHTAEIALECLEYFIPHRR